MSNGATVLDFPQGGGNGASPASRTPPSAMEILMGSAARSSAKRKRPGDGAAAKNSAGKLKASRNSIYSKRLTFLLLIETRPNVLFVSILEVLTRAGQQLDRLTSS